MIEINIFFDHLTEEIQKEVLEKAGVTDYTDLGWDLHPMATIFVDDEFIHNVSPLVTPKRVSELEQ